MIHWGPIMSLVAAACGAGDPSADARMPVIAAASWAARSGETIELHRAGADVAVAGVRIVARSRGAQELLPPQQTKDARTVWRYTPRIPGAAIIATSIEPPVEAAGPRIFRYEKLFIAVRPVRGDGTAEPSASAMARFGQRLELTPLVDPTLLRPGGDLPIRVKFEHQDLADAPVVVTRQVDAPTSRPADAPKANAAATQPGSTVSSSLATNASGVVNVRIDRPGVWTVAVEHVLAGDPAKAERFVGVMTFRVDAAAETPDKRSD